MKKLLIQRLIKSWVTSILGIGVISFATYSWMTGEVDWAGFLPMALFGMALLGIKEPGK